MRKEYGRDGDCHCDHILDFGRRISCGVKGAAFILTLFTDHKLDVIRVLPYSFHLAVEFLVGVLFLVAPIVLGFSGLDACYYWSNGAAVFVVVALHKPEAVPSQIAAMA